MIETQVMENMELSGVYYVAEQQMWLWQASEEGRLLLFHIALK